MGILSWAGVRLGGGTGLRTLEWMSEFVPRKVGLSAKGWRYSGGNGGVKRARDGGEYEGNSRNAGEAVTLGTGYLIEGIDGLLTVVVVDVVVVVVVNGDGTVERVVLAET